VRVAERDLALYLTYGVDRAGMGREGPFFKAFALANGVLQFMAANRVALGRDMNDVNPLLLAGQVLRTPAKPDERGRFSFDISSISIQASGRWPMGMASTAPAYHPAMRWCLDRSVGLDGRKHFDCAYAYHAGYAIAHYPFGVEPAMPGKALPNVVTDARHGSFVLRNRWRDADDAFAIYQLRSQALPALEVAQAVDPGSLRLYALGQWWLTGPLGMRPVNAKRGGRLVHWSSPQEGRLVVSADLSDAYQADLLARLEKRRRRRYEPPPALDAKVFEDPAVTRAPHGVGVFRDEGVRAVRHLAIDVTGRSGAAALVVLYEQTENAGRNAWRLPLPGARSVKGGLAAGDADGANATVRFLLPETPRIRLTRDAEETVTGAQVSGGGAYLMVMTLQRGEPPRITSSGSGDKFSVQVGDEVIRFDGKSLVFEK